METQPNIVSICHRINMHWHWFAKHQTLKTQIQFMFKSKALNVALSCFY